MKGLRIGKERKMEIGEGEVEEVCIW